MRNILKTFFVPTITIFLLSVSTFACTCVRDKIKSRGFSGQVFSVSESNPSYKEPLPQASIKLFKFSIKYFKRRDNDNFIAKVITDETGYFSLENIKAGRYILEANAPNFQMVIAEIKIIRSSGGKKDKLEIGLDPIIECCRGYAKVRN